MNTNNMFESTTLTIVICTYNRFEILDQCLSAITQQSVRLEKYKIIVVDNNSDDNTRGVVKKHIKNSSNIEYIVEREIGLSSARNKGLEQVVTKWIGYIDDDCKASYDFVERILQTINEYDFDVIGGKINPWFTRKKPRWLPYDFECNLKTDQKRGPTKNHQAIWGGSMFFKTNILRGVGGFPPELGMRGKMMKYGEESYVIERLNSLGFNFGIDPDAKVSHLISQKKYSFFWHIRSNYNKGKSSFFVYYQNQKISRKVLFRLLFINPFRVLFYSTRTSLMKNLFSPKPCLSCFFFDLFMPFLFHVGKARAGIKSYSTSQ